MAGAGFDARMIRDADRRHEGPRRPARLRRAPAPRTSAVRRVRHDDRASTARSGSTGEASCVLVGNVGTILGGIDGLRRRRARRRAPRARRGHRRGRRAVDAGARPHRARRTPSGRRSSTRRAAKRIDVRFDEATPYELDGGDRQDDEAPEDPGRARRAITRLRARRRRPMSTATLGPGDVGAHRRRRRATLLLATGRRQLLRDAFTRLRSPTASATPGRSPSRSSLVLVQAIIALVGLAAALGNDRHRATIIVRSLQAAVPGPGRRAPHRRGARRRTTPARRTSTSASCSGSSARSSPARR